MLFVTWNVNSLRARLPRVLELLETHAPDVVALQETKCGPDAFPTAELADLGYRAVHQSGGRWAGVALLIRMPLEAADPLVGLPADPVPEEARWCEATVDGIRFISTYVPNGRALDSPEYPRKLAFLDAAAARVAALRGQPLVLAGDLNIAPTDLDVYAPEALVDCTHVSAPEREALRRLLAAGDLLDAFRMLHPDVQQFTWWDYRAGNFHKNIGMRIDLTLLSRSLAAGLLASGIDRDFRKGPKPSDHAPVLTHFGPPIGSHR